MSETFPLLDLPEALNRSLGDAEFLQMMMDEFQKSIPDFIARFETALEHKDMETLSRDAHQLKGASANLGAKSVAALALELEKIGKNGESGNAGQALIKLKAEIEKFIQKLTEIDWTSL